MVYLYVLCITYVCSTVIEYWNTRLDVIKPWCLDGFANDSWYINVYYFSYVLYHIKRFHRPGYILTSIYDANDMFLEEESSNIKSAAF